MRRLLDDHVAGRFDHAYQLWSLLFLELWQRQWLDGSRNFVVQDHFRNGGSVAWDERT